MLGRLYIGNKLDFEHSCLIIQSYLGDTNNSFSSDIVDCLFDIGKIVMDISRDNGLNAEDCLMDILFDLDFSYRAKAILSSSNNIFFYNTSKDIYKYGLEKIEDSLKFKESIGYVLTSTEVKTTSDYKLTKSTERFDFIGIFAISVAAMISLKKKYFKVCSTSTLRVAILNVIRNGGLDKPLYSAFRKNVNFVGLRLNNKNPLTVFKFFRDEFIDYCEHDAKALDNYGCGFNIEPYLVIVAGVIFKNKLRVLKNFVNSKQIMMKESSNGEDKAVALVDRNDYVHKTTTDYPEFADDVRKIQACSSFCSISRGSKLFVYYDKLTSIKDVLVQERFVRSGLLYIYNDRSVGHADIKNLATSICPFKHTKDWKSCEFKSDSEFSKGLSKRKSFLVAADVLDSTPPDRVFSLFEAFRLSQYGSGSAVDDSKNRYVTKNYTAPDVDKGRSDLNDELNALMDFESKMLIALEAKIATDRFLKHLEEVNIDLFDISSAIASDVTLLNEFTTFTDFCDRYSISLKLRSSATFIKKDDVDLNAEVSKFILSKIKNSSSTFAYAMTEEPPFTDNSREVDNMFGVSEMLRVKGADYTTAFHKLMYGLTLLQHNKPLNKDIAFLSSVNKIDTILNMYHNESLKIIDESKVGFETNHDIISVNPVFPVEDFDDGLGMVTELGLSKSLKDGINDSVKYDLCESIDLYRDLDLQMKFLKHIYMPCGISDFNAYVFKPYMLANMHNKYVASNFKTGIIQDNFYDFFTTSYNPEHIPYCSEAPTNELNLNVYQSLFSRQLYLNKPEALDLLKFNGVVVNSSSFNEDFESSDDFMDFLGVLVDYSSRDYVKRNVMDLDCYFGALPIYLLDIKTGGAYGDLSGYKATLNSQLAMYEDLYCFIYNTLIYIRNEYKDLLITGSVSELFYYALYHYRLKGKIYTDCSKIMLTSSISKTMDINCDKLFAVASKFRFRNLLDPVKRFTGDYRDNLVNSVPIRLNERAMSEAITDRIITKIKGDKSILGSLIYSTNIGKGSLVPKGTPSEYNLTSFLNRLNDLLIYKSRGCDKYFVATQDVVMQKYAVLLNYCKEADLSGMSYLKDPKDREKFYRWSSQHQLNTVFGELKLLAKTSDMPFSSVTSKGIVFYSSVDLIEFLVTDSNTVHPSVWRGED